MFALLDDLHKRLEKKLLPAGKLREGSQHVLGGRDPLSVFVVTLYGSLKDLFAAPTFLFCLGGAAEVTGAPIAPPVAPALVPACSAHLFAPLTGAPGRVNQDGGAVGTLLTCGERSDVTVNGS
jgi:hypothetical protein